MTPEGPLYFLCYVSAARWLMSERELEALLARARPRNEARGITGMLLYADGSFLQVIEGDEQVVKRLFARIREDVRHRRVTPLLEGPLVERHFPNWRMGFERISRIELAEVPGFSRFLDPDFSLDELSGDPHASFKLLLQFRQNHRRHPMTGP